MPRLIVAFYVGVATIMGQQMAPVALNHIPTAWGYELGSGCNWEPRRWVYALGDPPVVRPDPKATAAENACWDRKGRASQTLLVQGLLTKWPDPETLKAMRAPHANRDPLPACEYIGGSVVYPRCERRSGPGL